MRCHNPTNNPRFRLTHSSCVVPLRRWVGSEPSAQAEVLSLQCGIEAAQLRAAQLTETLKMRQVVEEELEWQALQQAERGRTGAFGVGAPAWPALPAECW